MIDQFNSSTYTAGFLSVVVALCYWATVYALELLPRTVVFTPTIRKFLSDYAYPVSFVVLWQTLGHVTYFVSQIATLFFSGFVHITGPLERADVLKLPKTRAFYPTVDRGWLIHFWNLPVKWVFVALPIGILLTLLFYYDHVSSVCERSKNPTDNQMQNVSSLGAQARQYPLKKPAGFHWDFFLLGCTCFVGGILGIPLPNGLVPQAPVHTDSLTNYTDKLVVTHETNEDGEMVEHRRKTIVAESVVEQRLSHFFMGLGFIGTMTGPLLIVLHTMPRCLFAGVFLVVGWGSIEGNGITQKLIFLISEHRFIDPANPLLRVPKKKIALFILFQILGVGFSVAISQTVGAIGFPVIIISLIPLRWVVMPHLFSRQELAIMDALTADSDVALSSLGGKPEMPEVRLERQRNGLRNTSGEEGGVDESGTGSEKDQDTPLDGETDEGRRLRELEQSG